MKNPGRIRIPEKPKPPAFSCLEKVARRPDVEGTPCGITVLKQVLWVQMLRFSGTFLQTPALVIGVPSTFPRCGGDLLQQEKARGFGF